MGSQKTATAGKRTLPRTRQGCQRKPIREFLSTDSNLREKLELAHCDEKCDVVVVLAKYCSCLRDEICEVMDADIYSFQLVKRPTHGVILLF